MVDWLVIWGVTQAAGFVFKPILEDLAKEAVKDYAKDFFKDCLKNVLRLPEKDILKEAYGKALKEFLQLLQQELKNAEYQEIQIKQYIEPLKRFINNPQVESVLGRAFNTDCNKLNTFLLAGNWLEMDLPSLPNTFNWESVGNSYLEKVKEIIQESDKLRPIFAVKIQSQMAEDIRNLVGIAPDFDLGRYAESLMETYSNLRLDSLEIDGSFYRNLQLYKIFIPQNIKECQEFLPPELPKEYQKQSIKEVYPELSQHTTEELEQRHKNYINQKDLLIWEVIGEPNVKLPQGLIQHTVIFGDPGSGKSSLLQYLALNWAQRPISELSLYRLPLLVELRLYGRDKQLGHCKDLLSFIGQGDVPYRLNQIQLHEKLKTGSVIALFDGIDEIFDLDLRDRVVMDIHRFSNDYPQVQIITTSRRLGYKGERLRNAGFQHFMLQDLKIGQIKDFIERWHNLTFTNEVDKLRKKERLIKAIRDSKSIRELAGNPLLLTMMAILNRNQELPRNRSELYKKASEVLLHQWDVEVKLLENPKLKDWKIEIALIDKQKMLQKVAYFMQSNKNDTSGNLIRKSDLENILTESLREIIERGEPRMIARIMIEELRTRNFILCFLGADSYSFVHRTFLEYFCASEFVWQFKDDQSLKFDQLINEVFGQHWQDESWHEVLRLICGTIEPKFVAQIIDFLLKQKIETNLLFDDEKYLKREALSNVYLSINCFSEVKQKLMIKDTSKKLLNLLKDKINNSYTETYSQKLVNELMRLTINNFQEQFDIFTWLKNCLQNQSPFVRSAAAMYIIIRDTNQGKDSEIFHLIKNIILNDEDEWVRYFAIKLITETWSDNPETISLTQHYILEEKDQFFKGLILAIAPICWQEHPEVIPWLVSLSKNNEIEYDSCNLLFDLVELWRNEPCALTILQDIAKNEERSWIRHYCIEQIASTYNNNRGLIDFFADICRNDPFRVNGDKITSNENKTDNPRKAALEALLENFNNHPTTLEILNYLAENDPDEQLRKFSVQKFNKKT